LPRAKVYCVGAAQFVTIQPLSRFSLYLFCFIVTPSVVEQSFKNKKGCRCNRGYSITFCAS